MEYSMQVDNLKQRVEDSRAKALEPFKDLQNNYDSLLGKPPQEIQEKIDEVNQQHDSKLEKIAMYSNKFRNLMNLSDTQLRRLNANVYENDESFGTAKGTVNFNDDPVYSRTNDNSLKQNMRDRSLTGKLYWGQVFPEIESETKEVQNTTQTQKSDKVGISKLYRLTRNILSGSYSGQELRDLVKTLDYQITTYHPNLRSIFMPNIKGRDYTNIAPPDRWKEPQIEELLTNFSRLTLRDRDIDNSGLNSDIVYSGVFNPEIKEKIKKRKLTEKEYMKIENALNKLPESVPRHVPISTQTAIQKVEIGQLAVPFHIAQTERYDVIPNELLVIETGLSLRVVEGLKEQGLSGSEVVDAGIVMSDQGTNTQVIKTLHANGIDLEHAELLRGISKEYKVSVINLAGKVADELNGDVEELERFAEEFNDAIHTTAEERQWPSWRAFQHVFETYIEKGKRNIDRTFDAF
jgi:CRISPR/Cas system CSM-associated protein Csm2 small subunit